MQAKKSIQINITEPCKQKWAEMGITDKGRFCTHCTHEVIDFSTWNDRALHQFFAGKPDNVCGRFIAVQLNRPINIPYQPKSRLYRIFIAMGMSLIFTQSPLHAQNRPPATAQHSFLNQFDTTSTASGELKGTVLDEKKEPMISAVIQVYQQGVLKGGTVTDYDGNYSIRPLDPGFYEVLAIYYGYDSSMVTKVLVSLTNGATINFNMERKGNFQGYYCPFYMGKPSIINTENPDTKSFFKEDIKHMPR